MQLITALLLSSSSFPRAAASSLLALGFVFAAKSANAQEPAPEPATEPPAPSAPAPTPAEQSPPPAPPAPAPEKPSDLDIRARAEVGGYRDSFATAVLTPSIGGSIENPTAGWRVGGRYLIDVVSAASPDVVATASPRWSETRHAGNIDARYKPGRFGGGVGGTFSYTPDYLSVGVQGSLAYDIDEEKNWTVSLGGGYARDTIGRVDTSFSTFSRELDTVSGSLGLTRILGPRTLGTVTADFFHEDGDQSKPYRYIPLFAPADVSKIGRGASVDEVARLRIQSRPLEQLPLSRERVAGTVRLAHRFDGITLRGEQRVYGDTWGMAASTTEARLFFDVGRRILLGPTARFHIQTASAFYRLAYGSGGPADIPTLRTTDRELGALVSLSPGAIFRLGIAGGTDPMDYTLGCDLSGTYTSFAEALYTKERFSGLTVFSFEARFR